MPLTIEHDEKRDLTICIITGEVGFSEIIEITREFYEKPTLNVMWDALEGTAWRLSQEQIEKIVEFIKVESQKRPGGKTAFVTRDDVDFGIGRVLGTLAELKDIDVKFESFKDKELALAWLDEDQE